MAALGDGTGLPWGQKCGCIYAAPVVRGWGVGAWLGSRAGEDGGDGSAVAVRAEGSGPSGVGCGAQAGKGKGSKAGQCQGNQGFGSMDRAGGPPPVRVSAPPPLLALLAPDP